jgi:hypothetical protein
MNNYNVGNNLFEGVAILGDKGKVFLVFMMNLMIFIKARDLMKSSMDKHIQNIISI